MTTPTSGKDELRKVITEELLFALTKVRIDANKLGGLHYDVPDDALDELLLLIAQSNQAAVRAALMDARFNSYWGDGSPEYIDNKIKELDPSYDPSLEMDKRDSAIEAAMSSTKLGEDKE